MKLRTRVFMQLATLCLALAASSFAADNAYLYIANGIPGRDLAKTASPAYPVDVLIGGQCVPRNLGFGTTGGPYSFVPGTYDVQISESNTLAPCTNPAVIDEQVTLSARSSVTAVATINGAQPALLQFTNDLAAITAGSARFAFGQAAEAGTLEATLTQVGVPDPKTYSVTASAGAEQAINVLPGIYLVQVFTSGGRAVLTSQTITLPDQSATFTYATGQAANNSISLIYKIVDGLF
jgi:hypothetical protein